MDIKAFKMDGLGNDFVIIDRRKNEINLSKEQIINIGDRNNVGFDQIIFIEKEVKDVFPIKIYNPDGIEVGACGNGSRCIAYLISKENNQKNIKLEADKRILEAEILGEKMVRINMGFTKFKEWKDIPLIEGLNPRKVSIDFLEKEYGWKKYSHKHYESRFTKFFEGFWLRKKFNFDVRKIHYSSLILTNQITRNEALELLKKNPYNDDDINNEEDFEFNQDFEIEEGTRSPGWMRYQKRIK